MINWEKVKWSTHFIVTCEDLNIENKEVYFIELNGKYIYFYMEGDSKISKTGSYITRRGALITLRLEYYNKDWFAYEIIEND